MSEIIVKVGHIRKAGLCMNGARKWFESKDLSWTTFLDHGLPISTIEKLDDALGNMVCATAREEQDDGR